MGLCWGLGGIVGSIIGGLTEHPVRLFLFSSLSNHSRQVQNLPYFFGNSTLFLRYPYLLPCLISSSVTFTGAILSLFLSPDGGERHGGIHLPSEKDLKDAKSSIGGLPRKISGFFLGIGTGTGAVRGEGGEGEGRRNSFAQAGPRTSFSEGEERNPLNLMGTTSGNRSIGYGSAYGFNNLPPGTNPLALSRTSTRQSNSAFTPAESRYPTMRRGFRAGGGMRNASVATSTRYAPDYEYGGGLEGDEGRPTLTQRFVLLTFFYFKGVADKKDRLLLANEGAVFQISDLWVAAATQNDDTYSTYELEPSEVGAGPDSVFEDDESRVEFDDEAEEGETSRDGEPDFFGFGTAPPSLEDIRGVALQQRPGGEGIELGSAPAQRRSISGFGGTTGLGRVLGNGVGPSLSFAVPSSSNSNGVPQPDRSTDFSPRSRAISNVSRYRRVPSSNFGNSYPSTPAGVFGGGLAGAGGVTPRIATVFGNTGLRPSSLALGSPISPITPSSPGVIVGNGTNGNGIGNGNRIGEIQDPGLERIIEGSNSSSLVTPSALENASSTVGVKGGEGGEEGTSLMKQLPLTLIANYAVLALHGTTCDQVFMYVRSLFLPSLVSFPFRRIMILFEERIARGLMRC